MAPNSTSHVDVQDRILAEATRLFASRGFDGTSLQDIADAVGVRKASLLYHFASKDTLRQSVVEQMFAHWNETLPKILLAASSGHGRFDAVLQELIRFFAAEPHRATLISREVLDRRDEIAALMKSHVRPWAKVVADYVRQGQQAGRIHPDLDPEAYVVEMIILVVSSVATFHSLELMRSGRASTRFATRQLDELTRIARASLFIDAAATHSPAKRALKPKR